MNPSLKEKWIKELRSGSYVQGRECLKHQESDGIVRHCCLGVLAEVSKSERMVETNEQYASLNEVAYYFNGCSSIFDPNTLEHLGLTEDEQETLYKMNDVDEKSFQEIADYIEKNI